MKVRTLKQLKFEPIGSHGKKGLKGLGLGVFACGQEGPSSLNPSTLNP